MLAVAKATYCKNRITNRRVYPLSFMLSRIFRGIIDVCFPEFICYLLFKGHVSGNFAQYAGATDYMTYLFHQGWSLVTNGSTGLKRIAGVQNRKFCGGIHGCICNHGLVIRRR